MTEADRESLERSFEQLTAGIRRYKYEQFGGYIAEDPMAGFSLDGIVDLAAGVGSAAVSAIEPLAGAVEAGVGAYQAVQSVVNPATAAAPAAGTYYAGTRLPTQYGGVAPGYVDVTPAVGVPFVDVVRPQTANLAAQLGSPFVPTVAGARAQLFVALNPVSGRKTYFKPCGKPVLFSGDFAACKRVKRVASKARRRGGR